MFKRIKNFLRIRGINKRYDVQMDALMNRLVKNFLRPHYRFLLNVVRPAINGLQMNGLFFPFPGPCSECKKPLYYEPMFHHIYCRDIRCSKYKLDLIEDPCLPSHP